MQLESRLSEKVKKISEKMKGLSEKVLLRQRHARSRVESAQCKHRVIKNFCLANMNALLCVVIVIYPINIFTAVKIKDC